MPAHHVSVESAFFDQTQNISDTLRKFRLLHIIKKVGREQLLITPTGVHLQSHVYVYQPMPIHEHPHKIAWPPWAGSTASLGQEQQTDEPLPESAIVNLVRYHEPAPKYTPHLCFHTSAGEGIIVGELWPTMTMLFLIRMEYLIHNAHLGESIGAIGRLEMEL
jgi:hypothetical protein